MNGAALLAVTLAGLQACLATGGRMEEVLSWKQLDFQFPTAGAREAAIASGDFVAANNGPQGLAVWRDKLFVTVPRWKSGVPSTLNYVNITHGLDKSPVLVPYPDLATNTLPGEIGGPKDGTLPHKIVSVYRVRVDVCDRLWVIDSGRTDTKDDASRVRAPAKLLVYDLRTDKLLRQYAFKAGDVKEDSFFANVVVDTTPQTCDDAYAYVPDLGGFGVVVYSWRHNASWRVKHHFFHFDPLSGSFNVEGIDYRSTDGVFSIALSPVQGDGYRSAYFHALSSTHEFLVSTRVLQNKTIAELPESYYAYKVLGSRGPNTQASASDLDEKTGVLFYTQINRNGLGCWNSISKAEDYGPDTNALIASDNVTMAYESDVKVDADGNVWMLSNRLAAFLERGLDKNEVNFRVFKANVGDLIKGSVCDVLPAQSAAGLQPPTKRNSPNS